MSAGALPGFRDFYPPELAERNHLFGVWRDVAHRFGFAEYDGPPLEPLELYTKKSGDEIVGQLYNFADKGGREVALRPEMTPTFVRMVAARANSLRKPVRWFSIPQLFRYERQQKGRLREHFQLNVDIVGEADVAADAELLAVAIEIMRSCGLTATDVVARVSDRRLLSQLLRFWQVPAESAPLAFAVIDKIDREPRHVLVERLTTAGLDAGKATDLLDTVSASDLSSIGGRFPADPIFAEGLERMGRYLELLRAHGVAEWVRFDLAIVRGLAYYTGIVFELFDRSGTFRAICGGGRYDSLLRDLGGVDLPALGFGMGDVVLGEVLREKKLLGAREVALDFWVVPSAGVAPTAVVQAAAALRRVGLSTDYVLNVGRLASQKTSAQLGTAAKSGAAHALLLLPDGRNEIKDLRREAAPGFADLPRLWKAGSAEAYLQDSPRGVHDAIADILRRKRERHAGDADRP